MDTKVRIFPGPPDLKIGTIPGKCYGSTTDSKPVGWGSIPWLGAKFWLTCCQLNVNLRRYYSMQGEIMSLTNTKSQFGNAHVGRGPNEYNLRFKCPDCDKRRSGPCTHPSILNLKGNTK